MILLFLGSYAFSFVCVSALLPYSHNYYCFMQSPLWLSGKESACNAGDLGLIPGLGRSPGEGKGYPLQYSGLENSRDYTVHGVAKSRS